MIAAPQETILGVKRQVLNSVGVGEYLLGEFMVEVAQQIHSSLVLIQTRFTTITFFRKRLRRGLPLDKLLSINTLFGFQHGSTQ